MPIGGQKRGRGMLRAILSSGTIFCWPFHSFDSSKRRRRLPELPKFFTIFRVSRARSSGHAPRGRSEDTRDSIISREYPSIRARGIAIGQRLTPRHRCSIRVGLVIIPDDADGVRKSARGGDFVVTLAPDDLRRCAPRRELQHR